MPALVGPSPAVGAPTQEPSPRPPAREYIRPLDEFVHDAEDRQAIESERGTICGFFQDGVRQLDWYQSETGRHPGADSRHAEESFDWTAVRSLLQEAATTGKPVVIVCNRTPCSSHHRCDLIMEQLAGEAAALDPPVRLIFAFTGRYDPTRNATQFQALREIAQHGHEMFVAEPSTGANGWGVQNLSWEIQRLHAEGLLAVGSTRGRGSATEALSGQSDETGGIDLSTLELRYVAEPADGDGFQYAFAAQPAPPGQATGGGLRVAELQSDAFFTWLSLPTSAFWVNLNPDEPNRIIDEELGRTDVGRILLEADLQMKRTVGRLSHPDNPLGADFWNQLRSGSDNQICLSFRQWIVPGEALVHEDDDGLYILDAPLKVQLETDYFATQGVAGTTSCLGQDPAIEEHNESVFRSLILPEVERAVNEAPEYADLRRVYLSRVAAEWYRQRSLQEATIYGDLIDSGEVDRWASEQPWSPQSVFDQYVQSYTQGEYNITRQTQQGEWVVTNTYIYGGVDFATVLFDVLAPDELQATRPGLPELVDESFAEPAVDEARGDIWLGSETTPVPARTPSNSDTTGAPSRRDGIADPAGDGRGFTLVGPLAIVATIVMARLLVRRHRRRQGHQDPARRRRVMESGG